MTELQEKIFRRRLAVLEKVVGELVELHQEQNPKKVEQLRELMGTVKTQELMTEDMAHGTQTADRAPS